MAQPIPEPIVYKETLKVGVEPIPEGSQPLDNEDMRKITFKSALSVGQHLQISANERAQRHHLTQMSLYKNNQADRKRSLMSAPKL